MNTEIKIPVTEKAVIARIRRKLARELKSFHICRNSDHAQQIGWYYVTENNSWQWGRDDLEEIAIELECLKNTECLSK